MPAPGPPPQSLCRVLEFERRSVELRAEQVRRPDAKPTLIRQPTGAIAGAWRVSIGKRRPRATRFHLGAVIGA